MIRRLAPIVATLVCVTGCQPKTATQTPQRADNPPNTAPVPAAPAAAPIPTATVSSSQVDFKATGIKVSYPSTWSRVSSGQYALLLAPTGDASKNSVSIEIPKLPPHVPGLIPLGSVASGYVNDLKKQHPDLKTEGPSKTTVAGTDARRVTSKWTEKGIVRFDDAILTVHADHVYIFSVDSTEDQADAAKSELNAIVDSVAWQ